MAYDALRVDAFLHKDGQLAQPASVTEPSIPDGAMVPVSYRDSQGKTSLNAAPCVLYEGMYYFLYAWGWKHRAGGAWEPVAPEDRALCRPENALGPFQDWAPLPQRWFLIAPAPNLAYPYQLTLDLDLSGSPFLSLGAGPPSPTYAVIDPALLGHTDVPECSAWQLVHQRIAP